MRRARIVKLDRTCGIAPSQWEGLLDDGRHVFIHYRRRHGSIGIGRDIGEAVDATIDGKGWHWEAASEADPGFLSNNAPLEDILPGYLDHDPGILAGQPGWD